MRDRVRVGTGLPAQARSLAGERLIVPPLGRALEDPGHLGEQISPAPASVRSSATAAASSLLVRSRHLARCRASPVSRETRIRSASGRLSIMLSSIASIAASYCWYTTTARGIGTFTVVEELLLVACRTRPDRSSQEVAPSR
jgi:hypothetical protein